MIGLIMLFSFLKFNADIRTNYCLLQNPQILSKLPDSSKGLLEKIWDILEKADRWVHIAIVPCALEAVFILMYLINIVIG